MSLSLYDITIPTFIRNFKILSTLLQKGLTHTSGNEEPLLTSRLIADMHALPAQIQRASDVAKLTAVRLGKIPNEPWEDNEATFADLQERIRKTIAFLEKVDPKSFDGMEEENVSVGPPRNQKIMTGKDYVLQAALPNFYFHFTTAYALLRREGVPM